MEERKQINQADWLSEMKSLFPQGLETVQIKCVNCETVYSVKEFSEASGEPYIKKAANDAFQMCIGRYDSSKGCDWALYGLFQIHKLEVLTDDGKALPCMEFYNDEK